MSTASLIVLLVVAVIFGLLVTNFIPKSKPYKLEIDYTGINKSKKVLQSILSTVKRSTMDEVMAGLEKYAKQAVVELTRAQSLGLFPPAAREFAMKELEKQSICGAFIVDIEVDLYVKFLGENSQIWSITSKNNEFNRLYEFICKQDPSVFTLGSTLFAQKNSGGSLSVQLLSNLLSVAPESLTSAPKTGKVHADIHAVSPELNTYAAYETVTTKKIPFMIFLFNMNESEEGNEMRYDDSGRIPPEQEDHARLFLIVRPLTLLNPLYQGSPEYIEVLQKNKDFKA